MDVLMLDEVWMEMSWKKREEIRGRRRSISCLVDSCLPVHSGKEVTAP
jgi:hypothetical protein